MNAPMILIIAPMMIKIIIMVVWFGLVVGLYGAVTVTIYR